MSQHPQAEGPAPEATVAALEAEATVQRAADPSTIPAMPPAEPDELGVLRVALADIASGLDSRFVEAGSALSQTYTVVEKLVAALERVTNAVDGEGAAAAIGNMRATASRLVRLPSLQAVRAAALHDLQQVGVALRDEIDQVHRTLSFLRICGLNIKVTAAGIGEFGDFADGMFAKLDVAEAEMGGIAAEIETLVQTVPDVSEVERQLAIECAAVVPHVPASLAEDATALQQHQAALAKQAGQIADVARDVRTKVATALGALQVGDITRQRIEHVVAGLCDLDAIRHAYPDMDTAKIAVIRGHGIAMLAAQTVDAAHDFRRETGLLMQSLRGIAPQAAALLAFRPGGDGEEAHQEAAFLAGLEKSVGEAESVTGRLREADGQSQRLGNVTSATAENLGIRLRNVHRVKNDVQHLAWNTDLRCYRMGDEGRGLAVIASDIRGFAVTLEDISERIGRLFERLRTAANAIRDPQDATEITQSLAESLECIREGGIRMREGLGALGSDASAINDMLSDTTAKVDCDAVGGTLAEHAERLTALGAVCPVLPDPAKEAMDAVFEGIRQRYTMAREREIHREFVSCSDGDAANVVAADQNEEDDFDDGLF
ncbi:hypothetical protein J2X47_000661 [Sphingomonas sp. BE270]|nr:hypothetical protein [Sphingomonas sp. BE270]